MLILAMICTVTGLGITLLLRFDSFNRKHWIRWILLLISLKSLVLATCSVWYLDTHVKGQQFRHSWSSYVAWMAVGLSTLVILPVVYLIRLKPTASGNVKLEEFTRGDLTENEYILQHKHHPQQHKQFQYL